MDPISSTNLKAHLVVPHATVVQTECEANMLRVVRGLINRSVGTCVQGFDMRRIQLFFSIVNIISRFYLWRQTSIYFIRMIILIG